MKILHIIDSGGLYGAEVMLLNLAREQLNLGMDVLIASIGEKHIDEKPFEKEARKRGLNVKIFRMIPGPNIAGALEVLRYAMKQGVNILHSHGYKGNILFGFIPLKFRKLPMLSTLHGYTSLSGFSRMRVYESLDLISHRHIEQIVLVNEGMLTHPKLKNRKGIKYQVINNGIPVFEENEKETKPQHSGVLEKFCEKRKFIVGSIGRLSTEKGYNFLIEALSIVRKKGVDAGLVLIGEGYGRESLEQLIRRHELKDDVLMPGYFGDAKAYLSFFNIYVISSLTEGLPITLLEAMQAKVPIIATEVGGIPMVLGNGKSGCLVPPGKPESLADAIIEMYSNEKVAKEMVENAYKNVIQNYSSQQMAKEYFELYKMLVS